MDRFGVYTHCWNTTELIFKDSAQTSRSCTLHYLWQLKLTSLQETQRLNKNKRKNIFKMVTDISVV